MKSKEALFSERVQSLVRQIPEGRVMTYGQIAAICGNANAARVVGGIAHFGNPDMPWHRVVNKQGGLASGYPGGREGHKLHLEQEGLEISGDYKIVDFTNKLWNPYNEHE